MMRAIRAKLTYANVMATIAFFLALGGGAYAAIDLVGRNDIKSRHIAPNAAKGADVKESSFARVPNANAIDGIDSSELQLGNGFDTAVADFVEAGFNDFVFRTIGGDVGFVCDSTPQFDYTDAPDDPASDVWDSDGNHILVDDGTETVTPADPGGGDVRGNVLVWDGQNDVASLHLAAALDTTPEPDICVYTISVQENFPQAFFRAKRGKAAADRAARGAKPAR